MKILFVDTTFKRLKSNRLVADSTIVVCIKILSAIFSFCTTVAMGRLLGASNMGVYFVSLAVVSLCSILCRYGLDNIIVKEIAKRDKELGSRAYSNIYCCSFVTIFIGSSAAATLLFAFSEQIALLIFQNPNLKDVLRIMAIAIVPLNLLTANSVSLRAVRRFRESTICGDFLMPFLGFIFGVPLMYFGGVNGASVAYLLAAIVSFGVSVVLWKKHISTWRLNFGEFSSIFLDARHLFVASIVNRALIPWAPLLFVGFFGTASDAGIFGAINRLGMLVSIILVGVNSVVSPTFASLYQGKNMEELERASRRAAIMLTIVVLPISLFMIIYSEAVLSIFGPNFVAGVLGLKLIMIGRLVAASFGCPGQLLIMCDKEKYFKNTAFIVATLLLMLLLVFVPVNGANGAAFAVGVSLAVGALVNVYHIYTKIGVCSYMFGAFKIGEIK